MPCTTSLGAHTLLYRAASWMIRRMNAKACWPRRPVVSTANAKKVAPIFFSELTVLPALLGLSILQHSLCIRSAALYMRGGKGVRNTNINSDGLPEPSNEQVEALPARLLLLALRRLAFSSCEGRCCVWYCRPAASPPV